MAEQTVDIPEQRAYHRGAYNIEKWSCTLALSTFPCCWAGKKLWASRTSRKLCGSPHQLVQSRTGQQYVDVPMSQPEDEEAATLKFTENSSQMARYSREASGTSLVSPSTERV